MSASVNSVLQEEIEVLEAIYIHELEIEKTDNGDISRIILQLHPATGDELDKRYVCMTLILAPPPQYPDEPPDVDIKNPRGIAEEEIQSLVEDIHKMCLERTGGPMLYELIELAKESLTEGNVPHTPCMICLEHFTAGDQFTKTDCYHYFHCTCLSRYVHHVLEEEEEEKISLHKHKKEKEVMCPVCREQITYDLSELDGAAHFSPVETTVTLPPKLRAWQEEMATLLQKQRDKGGVIDVEAEKNKFLVSDDIVITLPAPESDKSAEKNKSPQEDKKSKRRDENHRRHPRHIPGRDGKLTRGLHSRKGGDSRREDWYEDKVEGYDDRDERYRRNRDRPYSGFVRGKGRGRNFEDRRRNDYEKARKQDRKQTNTCKDNAEVSKSGDKNSDDCGKDRPVNKTETTLGVKGKVDTAEDLNKEGRTEISKSAGNDNKLVSVEKELETLKICDTSDFESANGDRNTNNPSVSADVDSQRRNEGYIGNKGGFGRPGDKKGPRGEGGNEKGSSRENVEGSAKYSQRGNPRRFDGERRGGQGRGGGGRNQRKEFRESGRRSSRDGDVVKHEQEERGGSRPSSGKSRRDNRQDRNKQDGKNSVQSADINRAGSGGRKGFGRPSSETHKIEESRDEHVGKSETRNDCHKLDKGSFKNMEGEKSDLEGRGGFGRPKSETYQDRNDVKSHDKPNDGRKELVKSAYHEQHDGFGKHANWRDRDTRGEKKRQGRYEDEHGGSEKHHSYRGSDDRNYQNYHRYRRDGENYDRSGKNYDWRRSDRKYAEEDREIQEHQNSIDKHRDHNKREGMPERFEGKESKHVDGKQTREGGSTSDRRGYRDDHYQGFSAKVRQDESEQKRSGKEYQYHHRQNKGDDRKYERNWRDGGKRDDVGESTEEKESDMKKHWQGDENHRMDERGGNYKQERRNQKHNGGWSRKSGNPNHHEMRNSYDDSIHEHKETDDYWKQDGRKAENTKKFNTDKQGRENDPGKINSQTMDVEKHEGKVPLKVEIKPGFNSETKVRTPPGIVLHPPPGFHKQEASTGSNCVKPPPGFVVR